MRPHPFVVVAGSALGGAAALAVYVLAPARPLPAAAGAAPRPTPAAPGLLRQEVGRAPAAAAATHSGECRAPAGHLCVRGLVVPGPAGPPLPPPGVVLADVCIEARPIEMDDAPAGPDEGEDEGEEEDGEETGDEAAGEAPCAHRPDAEGRFELALAAGRWELRAATRDRERQGRQGPLDLSPEARLLEGVVIPLAPAARLAGVARDETGAAVPLDAVTLWEPGARAPLDLGESVEVGDDGRFAVGLLLPGPYRLHLVAGGFRARRLEVLATASTADVVVTLARAPILWGAAGDGGEGCPYDRLIVTEAQARRVGARGPHDRGDGGDHGDGDHGGEEPIAVLELDGRCRFAAQLETEAAFVRVTAEDGTGVTTEVATIGLPARGDPPPLCLGGPCPPAAVVIARVPRAAPGRVLQHALLKTEGPDGEHVPSDAADAGERFVLFGPVDPGPARVGLSWSLRPPGRAVRHIEMSVPLHAGINELALPGP
jgi:hypothetical protein